MTIVYGIIGLSFLVLIHELGHFALARLTGVTVETFSIGMGPVLLHKTFRGVDYRISLFPLGGYCGMKGDKTSGDATNPAVMMAESDSFFGTTPLRRILISLAGPAVNALFAVAAFAFIGMAGYTYYSSDAKIILADEIYDGISSPAREAGFLTGDKILAIDGKKIQTFSELSHIVSMNAKKELTFLVERGEKTFTIEMSPEFDKSSGAGRIGVAAWIDPVIEAVEPGSIAANYGLYKGDVIKKIDGEYVDNAALLSKKLQDKTEFVLLYERKMPSGNSFSLLTKVHLNKANEMLGIAFNVPEREAIRYSFFPAIIEGLRETWETAVLTAKSLSLLVKGVETSKVLSGPARITVMLGDTVKNGFSEGARSGVVSLLNLLALISVSLCFMNLLPLPVLDGGHIVFSVAQMISKKPPNLKLLSRLQFIGVAVILVIFFFAITGDIEYFIDAARSK